MKRKKIIIMIAVAVITVIIAAISCDNGNGNVDPIHGTAPCDTTFWSGENGNIFPLEEFHKLGEENDTTGQRAMVDKYRRVLTTNVVAHYTDIKSEKNIRFVLGSGFATDVKSGDGKTYSGSFRNELIIIINDPSVKDTLFLACGNGMLSPLELYSQTDLGTAAPWRIVILPGEGIANHLPELQAWANVAGKCNIPIKDKRGNIVSQETYLKYLGRYESVLFPYDVIDVANGEVYDRNGNKVNFNKRIQKKKKQSSKR